LKQKHHSQRHSTFSTQSTSSTRSTLTPRLALFTLCALIVSLAASISRAATDVWVYTSIYKEFITPIQKAFEAKHPEYKLQVFQAGSEKIQAKLEAELVAQKPQADILVISDPFYAADLEKRSLVFKPAERAQAAATNYYSLMVLITHKDVPKDKRPTSFADLSKPEFKALVQAGSPLESGTAFATVAYLSQKLGWDYFKKLAANALASSGGNSAVIQKVESGEKKVGMVLLENALAAQKKGSPIEIIYPADGSIAIPSVQVILKDSKAEEGARKFGDFLLTKDAQKLLLNGYMYSIDKSLSAPVGAKPFAEVTKGFTPWTAESLRKTGEAAKEIKSKFAELILE
jgi:iron(III) transport system substrate-binding protein